MNVEVQTEADIKYPTDGGRCLFLQNRYFLECCTTVKEKVIFADIECGQNVCVACTNPPREMRAGEFGWWREEGKKGLLG